MRWNRSFAAMVIGVAAALAMTILLWIVLMCCNSRPRVRRASTDGDGTVRPVDEHAVLKQAPSDQLAYTLISLLIASSTSGT